MGEVTVDMCQALQEMIEDAKQIGWQDGELKKAKEVARRLWKPGGDIGNIAQIVGYPVEDVKEWVENPEIG